MSAYSCPREGYCVPSRKGFSLTKVQKCDNKGRGDSAEFAVALV